jgi:hypothetical protein
MHSILLDISKCNEAEVVFNFKKVNIYILENEIFNYSSKYLIVFN